MVNNATLLRLDRPMPATSGGVVERARGKPLRVRCILDEVTATLRHLADQERLDATALLYVKKAALAGALASAGYGTGVELEPGQAIQVQQDGDLPLKQYAVLKVIPRSKGHLTHRQVLLKEE